MTIHRTLLAVIALCGVLCWPATTRGSASPALAQAPGQRLEGPGGPTVLGICYSGFRAGQHPDRGDGAKNPTDEQILEDLLILRDLTPFRLLRMYDARENTETVLELIVEHDLPFRVMLGAWLQAEVNNPDCPWKPEPFTDDELAANKLANATEIGHAIRLANAYPEIVNSVAVGNEALVIWNDHMVPVESVIAYVRTVKAAVQQPVTVADNYDWWAKHGAPLAAELDFVSVHIYPVWEERDIDQGISYGIENMQRVRDALPDAKLVITEAGWATTASEFGPRASEAKQARYVRELYEWAASVNITTYLFEAFDEPWKGDPNKPMGAEKHWGIFFEDRTPKEAVGVLDELNEID